MSQPPAAPVQYAYPPTPAQPPPPKKKKRGCCSCCLWLVVVLVVLAVSFVVAAQFIMRTPSNPVKEEYESIPDYFSLLAPESRGNQSGDQGIRKGLELRIPHPALRTWDDPQSAIRNPQLSGGNHV